jgi:hypothetical protein
MNEIRDLYFHNFINLIQISDVTVLLVVIQMITRLTRDVTTFMLHLMMEMCIGVSYKT